jgi:hypothetical protein
MKKYAMYIGRWQNWHKGHEWLIRQQLDEGKNVWVAIRDVEIDENNPKTAQQVMIDLTKESFISENWDRIHLSIIPDIESINYGRGVGYDVIYHEPPHEISKISGTAIRAGHIKTDGSLNNYLTESDIEKILEANENPPEPNSKLYTAVQRFKKLKNNI